MERIIHIATEPGDIVFDCFGGSGTTAAVAAKMNRRWVTVERSHSNVDTYLLPRMEKVVAGEDPGGVTALTGWQGGGGFRLLDVAASMFTRFEDRVVLAEWAAGGVLAECVAAQAGFPYDDADPPFAGRKGKKRLAVVDGLVNEDVLELLVGWLAADELVVVYGTGIDPACRSALARLRRGSLVRKIPQSVLDDYRGRATMSRSSLEWPSLASVPAAREPETVA